MIIVEDSLLQVHKFSQKYLILKAVLLSGSFVYICVFKNGEKTRKSSNSRKSFVSFFFRVQGGLCVFRGRLSVG